MVTHRRIALRRTHLLCHPFHSYSYLCVLQPILAKKERQNQETSLAPRQSEGLPLRTQVWIFVIHFVWQLLGYLYISDSRLFQILFMDWIRKWRPINIREACLLCFHYCPYAAAHLHIRNDAQKGSHRRDRTLRVWQMSEICIIASSRIGLFCCFWYCLC